MGREKTWYNATPKRVTNAGQAARCLPEFGLAPVTYISEALFDDRHVFLHRTFRMTTFKPGAVLLHAVAVGIMTYAWFEIDNLPNTPWIENQKGGHFQFLTIQGYVCGGPTQRRP